MEKSKGLGFGLVIWAAGGCAAVPEAATGAGGESNEPVAQAQEPLTTCGCDDSSYTTYTTASMGPTIGPSETDNICWPTSIKRPPAAETSMLPYVDVYRNNVNWIATGWGQMTCVPKCCFGSNGGSDDVRWISGSFVATARARTETETEVLTHMWENDAMGIISGFMHSGSEGDRSSMLLGMTSSPAYLIAIADSLGSTTTAKAYSFFVGTPGSGHQVRYQNDAVQPGVRKSLIPSAAGICTFHSLKRFDRDFSTIAALSRVNGVWKADNNTDWQAQTLCYPFDQSQ